MVRRRERESQQDIRNWQKGTTNREREGDGEIRMGRLSWSRLPLVPLLLLRAQRVPQTSPFSLTCGNSLRSGPDRI